MVSRRLALRDMWETVDRGSPGLGADYIVLIIFFLSFILVKMSDLVQKKKMAVKKGLGV